MKLNVLICSFERGILNLARNLPDPDPDVSYFISYQSGDQCIKDLPTSLLGRNDVFLSILNGRGLSKNRNNVILLALNHCVEGYFLLADDDVVFVKGFKDVVFNSFRSNVYADLLCFKVKTIDCDLPFKSYSQVVKRLRIWNIDKVSSIEVSGKVSVLNNISFDENLGLGAEFPSGEETAFLADCIRYGYIVKFVPEYIVMHKYESTGKKLKSYCELSLLENVGGRAYRIYGLPLTYFFFIFSCLSNFRFYHSKISPIEYFRALIRGMRRFKTLVNG